VKVQPYPVLPQLCFVEVQFERAKSDYFRGPPRHPRKKITTWVIDPSLDEIQPSLLIR
jgi:hypothetical protein